MKRIMVDMSATLIHHGHVRLLAEAARHGRVIVGLASDAEILLHKGFYPELNFAERKEILLAIRHVDEVVETPWLITEEILDWHHIDLLFHGSDNSNLVPSSRLLLTERTQDISSSDLRTRATESIVAISNRKWLFTPGPSNLHPMQLLAVKPVFGRNDPEYDKLLHSVTTQLLRLSGHQEIACLQGSATLALEIALRNFVAGKVLLIGSGYYAQRIGDIITRLIEPHGAIRQLERISDPATTPPSTYYDWCIAVYTETASAFRIDLQQLHMLSKKVKARLLLDATGSIGLEDGHEQADVIAYSACKGLLGPTGAAFVAFNHNVPRIEERAWYLSLQTHLEHRVTGPYHALCVLESILPQLPSLRAVIAESKALFMHKFSDDIVHHTNAQPLLCTQVRRKLRTTATNVLLYQPRQDVNGAIVSHLLAACIHPALRNTIYDTLELLQDAEKC